ncbi:hypothetical protein Q0812_03755 [Brevundimonas sp. 2R-24]|uniref:DUF4829 domain-containing protein n=1 Tax=Peiella sedimenti TaxID=3061083 RepID=A0ABT8SJI5_9CAUL|nr:hypothetical protein [Caulobacteraceae bacterium XZ-24]
MKWLWLIMSALLASCSMPSVDPERAEQTLQVYRWVRDGDAQALSSASTGALLRQLTPETLENLRSYTRPGEPQSSEVIGWSANVVDGGPSSYQVAQRLDYGETYVIVTVVMVQRRPGGEWFIDGVHLNQIDAAAAQSAGGFSLSGKRALHYVALAGAVAAPILCLVTAAVAGWRRRWAWMILSLFGVGQFALNWATGEWQIQAVYISVFGAGAFKGPGLADPWILYLSLPLPALLFWLLGKYRPKPAPTASAA